MEKEGNKGSTPPIHDSFNPLGQTLISSSHSSSKENGIFCKGKNLGEKGIFTNVSESGIKSAKSELINGFFETYLSLKRRRGGNINGRNKATGSR